MQRDGQRLHQSDRIEREILRNGHEVRDGQVDEFAKKAGVKQPAISRFEKRGEVKLSTLAATIKALGGKLEVRARFSDADVPISLLASKK